MRPRLPSSARPPRRARLQNAESAKKSADAAIVAKAAEKGCVANCRQLLQAQADAAAAEVSAARDALDASHQKVRQELADARAALASMKAPVSATPLADRTGIEQWLLDLLGAGLGSITANGLACCLLIFAAHHHRPAARIEIINPEPVTAPARKVLAAPARNRSPTRPTAHRKVAAKDRAAQFALECLEPKGKVELVAIQNRYGAWAAERPGDKRFSPAQIGKALAELFEETGITVTERDGQLIAMGISLKEPEKDEAAAA